MTPQLEGEWCERQTAALLERLQADVCSQMQALEQRRKRETRMTRILALALAAALSVVLLLFAAGAAHAQTCNVASAPSAGYACSPSPIGVGSSATIRSNAAGVVAWWYCPAPATGGAGALQFGAVTLAAMGDAVTAVSYQAVAAMTMPNPDLAFRNALTTNVTLPLDDPALMPVWCPYWSEMQAGIPVVAPAPVVSYVVAKNGTSTTRPVYMLAGGKLTSTILRAPVGAACSGIVTIGSSTYGTFAGAPAPQAVAICARAP
jgi:predicted nucleic acid-binding Zn ribbon protein